MARHLGCALILLLMTVVVVVTSFAPSAAAETHTGCGVAQTAFSFCVAYIAGIDHTLSPKCCMGVQSLKELAPTRRDEQNMCLCLKQMLVSAGGVVDGSRAAGLPGKCGVSTRAIPTSVGHNCNG